jgi:hypothetical protein
MSMRIASVSCFAEHDGAATATCVSVLLLCCKETRTLLKALACLPSAPRLGMRVSAAGFCIYSLHMCRMINWSVLLHGNCPDRLSGHGSVSRLWQPLEWPWSPPAFRDKEEGPSVCLWPLKSLFFHDWSSLYSQQPACVLSMRSSRISCVVAVPPGHPAGVQQRASRTNDSARKSLLPSHTRLF